MGIAFFNSARKPGTAARPRPVHDDLRRVRDEGFASTLAGREAGTAGGWAVTSTAPPCTERAPRAAWWPEPDRISRCRIPTASEPLHDSPSVTATSRSFGSTCSRSASTSTAPYTLRICSRTSYVTRTVLNVTARTSRPWRAGSRPKEPSREISFTPAASSCRTSPVFPQSSIWRRCETPCAISAGTRRRSIRSSPSSSSSITRCRSTSTRTGSRSSATRSLEFERNRERYAFLRWAGGVRQLQGRASEHGHRPSGEPRVSRARRRRARWSRVPGHARGDGLTHDDDQRTRRARLGGRRHRSRGGDAGRSVSRCWSRKSSGSS